MTRQVRLRHILKERDVRGMESERVLSVYREHGVVLKESRDDNFNKTPQDLSSYKLVNPGDVVVNKMKAWQGSIAVSQHRGIVSGDYLVCAVAADGVLPAYLHHLLRSHPMVDEYRRRSSGIRPAQWRLYWEDLADVRVSLPSVGTQQAIADYLDTETARIDALVAKKRRMIELLHERWRSEAEHRMHALSRELGSIALKRVVQCLDGKRIPLSAEERSQRQGDYPYYGASGAIDTIDDYLFDETLVLLGEDGAQLADPDYEIAFVVRGKVWVNNHAHVLRPIRANPDFLAFHLSTLDRGMFISGATREKITQADMSEIPVPDMPLEAQARVAGELLAGRARCDATADALRKQLDLLAEHRQALITAAVTGELDVSKAA